MNKCTISSCGASNRIINLRNGTWTFDRNDREKQQIRFIVVVLCVNGHRASQRHTQAYECDQPTFAVALAIGSRFWAQHFAKAFECCARWRQTIPMLYGKAAGGISQLCVWCRRNHTKCTMSYSNEPTIFYDRRAARGMSPHSCVCKMMTTQHATSTKTIADVQRCLYVCDTRCHSSRCVHHTSTGFVSV